MAGKHGDRRFPKIIIFRQRANYAEAADKGTLPFLKDFILALKDPDFVKRSCGSWYWLRDTGLPREGYHKIDYPTGCLSRVSDTEYYAMPFGDRAFVAAARDAGHPAIFIFGNYDDSRLAVDSFSDPRFSARLALVAGSP